MKPVRIQRSRKHKQVSPNGLPIVYVGRPSKWGNPFKVETLGNGRGIYVITQNIKHGKPLEFETETYTSKRIAQIKAVQLFEKWYRLNWGCVELAGKNLSCWCKIGEPCHADILLKLANQ